MSHLRSITTTAALLLGLLAFNGSAEAQIFNPFRTQSAQALLISGRFSPEFTVGGLEFRPLIPGNFGAFNAFLADQGMTSPAFVPAPSQPLTPGSNSIGSLFFRQRLANFTVGTGSLPPGTTTTPEGSPITPTTPATPSSPPGGNFFAFTSVFRRFF